MRFWFAVSVFFLLLMDTASVFAGEVGHARAQSVAQNWLQRSRVEKMLDANTDYSIIGEEPVVVDNKTVGYNFLLSPVGHIVVPSRDELPVVKLYSYTTTVSMADDTKITRWIKTELSLLNDALASHAAEMATVDHAKTKNGLLWTAFDKSQGTVAPGDIPSSATAQGSTIGPLLSTTWDQDAPYNLNTPRWYDGQATLTGCVATAAAQIMKYWNYPATGQGSTSYTWNNGSVNRTLSANFASSNYNWSAMADNYGGGTSTTQNEAVAKLMADVGIAFNMTYGTSDIGGSSAYISKGTTVFPTYFGYKSTISLARRSNYASDSAWMQVFKNEIQNGRPVEFGIFTDTSGHAIVVDGYRDSPAEQIHLNLGWSGSYDGWYVANNIVTGSYNWSDVTSQHALIGIEPANTATSPSVTTKPATSVAAADATLNGTINPNGVSTSGYFQYGTTTGYGSSTDQTALGSGRTLLPVSAGLSGLSCGGTVYHYRAVGDTGTTRYYGSDATFTTSACTQTKPTATTDAATEVGQASATLNGTVNPNGASSTAYFQYGGTAGYGSATGATASFTNTVQVTFNLSGLNCGGNSYHYRIVASSSGGTSYGADTTFVTGACAQTPPTVTTGAAGDIGQTGATLNGSVTPNGTSTTGYFQYGATNGYGSTTTVQGLGSGSGSVALSAALSGLTCGGTTYHYRAVATNSGGPAYGSDLTFNSAACPNTAPNPFSFTAQNDVAPNSVATSNVILVSGLEAPSPIGISAAASYSVNGAAYTTAAGTVDNGDMVTVRVTSSPNYAAATSATLTIGGVAGVFRVTTVAAASGGVNLVQNPDFESGDVTWTSFSSEGFNLITNVINWGNSGSDWFAFLGGYDSLDEYIYQDVAIPGNATASALTFYYYITTDETSDEAWDTMKVEVVDPANGSVLAQLQTLSNLDATTGWAMSQSFNLLAYKGRTVRLRFSDATDASYPTSFLVDEVSVVVTGPSTDSIAPTVRSTLPLSGATGVAVNSAIKAVFSEAMTPSTINASTFSLAPPVAGTVSYDPATYTATFTPSTNLAANLSYTATIGAGVKDAAGNPMAAAKTWSFTASAASWSNLLKNGSFESGFVDWSETNSADLANVNLNAGLGHNDSDWYLFTGSVDNLSSATYQDVAIPANASEAYAQFWYKISTAETSSSVWDTMAVQIVNPATGTVLRTLQSFSNLDQTSGWVQSARYDLTAYKGQSIRLNFLVSTDTSNPTFFRVDDAAVMVAASPATGRALSATVSGGGSGTVNSNPSGIACASGTCTAQFGNGAAVTLMASPATSSLFAGWSGACSNTSGNCVLTMDADKAVTATFTAVAPVRLAGPSAVYYGTAQAAYNAATGNGTIQAQGVELTEDLILNRGIRVTFAGGYDSGYQSSTGMTILNGTLRIRSGSAVVNKLKIR